MHAQTHTLTHSLACGAFHLPPPVPLRFPSRRSNLTFGVPVLTPLPPPSPALDLFSNNSYPFTSYNSLPTTVSHQRLNRLNPFAYVPTSVTQHYVTDCDPVADLSRLIILTSAYPAISLPDALEANATYVSFLGYSGGSVGYSGGNLFFLVDRAQVRDCVTVWLCTRISAACLGRTHVPHL